MSTTSAKVVRLRDFAREIASVASRAAVYSTKGAGRIGQSILVLLFCLVVVCVRPALSGTLWRDMNDPGCLLSWHRDGSIDYQHCKEWRFVSASVLPHAAGRVWVFLNRRVWAMHTASGITCYAVLDRDGPRLSVERIPSERYPCLNATFQEAYHALALAWNGNGKFIIGEARSVKEAREEALSHCSRHYGGCTLSNVGVSPTSPACLAVYKRFIDGKDTTRLSVATRYSRDGAESAASRLCSFNNRFPDHVDCVEQTSICNLR